MPRLNIEYQHSFYLPLTKESLPIIILGVSAAVAGLFLILSKSVTIPQKVNATIPRMGNYLVGSLLIGGGAISSILGVIHNCKMKDAAILSTATDDLDEYRSSSSDQATGIHFRHSSNPADPDSAFVTSFSFFYPKCDRINDLGWGCGWRSIQICASSLNLYPAFKELLFGYRKDQSNSKELAEPGYGQRYLMDVGIKSQIVFYNRERGTDKTPLTEECLKIKGFQQLRDKILQHFKTQNTPIMADDVSCALTIVGIRLVGDRTLLFIADPHKLDAENGLYWVELDETGKQLRTNGKDYEDRRNGSRTVKKVFFSEDKKEGWILLFPEPHPLKSQHQGPQFYDL